MVVSGLKLSKKQKLLAPRPGGRSAAVGTSSQLSASNSTGLCSSSLADSVMSHGPSQIPRGHQAMLRHAGRGVPAECPSTVG